MEWIDIIGFDGLYEICKSGLIRYKPTGKVRHIGLSQKGYPCITLYKNKKGHFMRLHRLIAIHFIPNPDNKPHINHKNGVKTDNSVDNLEWVTPAENMKHGWRNGYFDKNRPKGEINNFCKLKEKDVLFIRSSELKPDQLAKRFKVSGRLIYKIRHREVWKHLD